ncbi:AhpA/YtjB family protein [Salinivibrio sp. ES.052]|uniref:AhpA/YtjB family protein n=1 Tax=Salinivibrio sp. ES.052 TaxID=1882823 RepID=UPI00092AEDD4|nr:AhpA/YtjB family protein [Salinivibrio sp. ES.052]SIN73042.1 membrane protein [Salinivibrio sp. ES.052]
MFSISRKALRRITKWGVLVSALSAVAALMLYSITLSQKQYQALYQQTDQLAQLMTRQIGAQAYDALVDKNYQPLQTMADQLAAEPLIRDASFYQLNGSPVVRSTHALPLETAVGLTTPLGLESQGRQQLMTPVSRDGDVIGFLRLTIEHQSVIDNAKQQLQSSMTEYRALIGVALLLGALLMRMLTRGDNRSRWLPW